MDLPQWKNTRGTVKNCRVYNSFEVGSNHSLLSAYFKFKRKKSNRQTLLKKFDVEKLVNNRELAEDLTVEIVGRFEPVL